MEQIKDVLMQQGYTAKQAETVASELTKIDNSLLDGLQAWISSEKETDYTIEGITLSDLKQTFKMSYPAALLTMDWLIKEPELAQQSINRGIK